MIREVSKNDDLNRLLLLYTKLHDNPMPEQNERLSQLWVKIIQEPNYHIIVAEEDDKIVSTCSVMIILNLTHCQRPYALVENVVTDEKYRKKGLATACLKEAISIAQKEKCYKIMLMTGSKEEDTLRFYEKAGFNQNDKTAFIRWL